MSDNECATQAARQAATGTYGFVWAQLHELSNFYYQRAKVLRARAAAGTAAAAAAASSSATANRTAGGAGTQRSAPTGEPATPGTVPEALRDVADPVAAGSAPDTPVAASGSGSADLAAAAGAVPPEEDVSEERFIQVRFLSRCAGLKCCEPILGQHVLMLTFLLCCPSLLLTVLMLLLYLSATSCGSKASSPSAAAAADPTIPGCQRGAHC